MEEVHAKLKEMNLIKKKGENTEEKNDEKGEKKEGEDEF